MVAVACGLPPPLEEESVVLLPGSKSCRKCRRLGGHLGQFFTKGAGGWPALDMAPWPVQGLASPCLSKA